MPFTAKGRVLHQPVGENLKLDFRNIVLTQKGRLKKDKESKIMPQGSTLVPVSAGVKDGNWIQTMPGKGYFVCLRRSNRSSTRHGGRARSNWYSEATLRASQKAVDGA
jgi:hypothetical protein